MTDQLWVRTIHRMRLDHLSTRKKRVVAEFLAQLADVLEEDLAAKKKPERVRLSLVADTEDKK